ncbi:ABC transporter permease [Minwuia sp.]|uniref:ABC transporter permease n=1 Tax=Minwuia sp. TaxID=2493630 RepID=UPI003A93262D
MSDATVDEPLSGVETHRVLGFRVSPLNKRRWQNFKRNRRGYWSAILFLIAFVLSLFAELIANDKPLMISYEGDLKFPVLFVYTDEEFGGFLPTEAEYREDFMREALSEGDNWALWPLIEYDYRTPKAEGPFPQAPTAENWLGTDDQGRDVMARVIYGYRLSVLFGIMLTVLSTIIGVAAGAVQGFYGGWLDLIAQRFIEIWEGMPFFFIILIFSALFIPGFWTLLFILLIFSWTALVAVVRAEFLRARNFDYVRAARALGVGNGVIMFKHLLPNAMVATITFMPFILTGAITSLTALDLLGLGLPPGSPSLGELLAQGKSNLQAPWLGITGFVVISFMLTLVMFMAEALRDAFDPRKSFA